MKEKNIILAARVVSMLFTPLYLSTLGMIALFVFSYFSLFALSFKISVILVVYLFTILLPSLLIRTYRKYHGWTPIQLGARERRMVPYVISICCYLLCLYIMNVFRIPHFMCGILIAALVVQLSCSFVNIWWKISTHSAGIGGVTGALLAFSLRFNFNPVWWLCLVILLAGAVGTSRIILRQHTVAQVIYGYLLGTLCGFIVLMKS